MKASNKLPVLGVASVLAAWFSPTGCGDPESPPRLPSSTQSFFDAGALPRDGGGLANDAASDANALGDLGWSQACLRVPAALGQAEHTYVVGVFEAMNAAGVNRRGPVTVRVTNAASPATLVLNSYFPVDWNVELEGGAKVASVLVLSQFTAETTVNGLAGVSVEKLQSADPAYDWKVEGNEVNGDFAGIIQRVRDKFGKLESGFQGKRVGEAFTVPYAGAADVNHYEAGERCQSACTPSPGPARWQETPPTGGATIGDGGLEALLSGYAQLRSTRGFKCGKHYFEVEQKNGVDMRVAVARLLDPGLLNIGLSRTPGARVTESIVGVALDLDGPKARVFYRTQSGWVPPIPSGPTPTSEPSIGADAGAELSLWLYGEVAPAVDSSQIGSTIKLVSRPPFTFPIPPGYSADL